ncbi:hypothetical protein MIND_01323500 [Mycena indigotica]|uniref:Uncharacterized protein n=1 Tax=Mycena indigotica TaxID=2126181 RepID=A0A8H6VUR3_9AGAR|nr:uncharacterized protein MIND_01323500 [Mycena indigotica]KAF7290823.1 hypothetical protein MIND_01323500 [Mycena indigotica]
MLLHNAFWLLVLGTTAIASQVFGRQSISRDDIDPSQIPSQCVDTCQRIIETFNTCMTIQCICAPADQAAILTCVDCLASFKGPNTLSGQDLLSQYDSRCASLAIHNLDIELPVQPFPSRVVSQSFELKPIYEFERQPFSDVEYISEPDSKWLGLQQHNLEALIREASNCDDVLITSKQYSMSEAPNPCIQIEGIGPVGLPLSAREARFLVETAPQEIRAQRLRIDNPDWEPWLNAAATSALQALSWTGAALDLKALVVRSSESAYALTEECTGQLFIVLPSRFDGGDHEIHWSNHTKAINVAAGSSRSTTVVAVVSGVGHSIRPTNSGYSLTLVYNIIPKNTTHLSRRSWPDMPQSIQRLRTILQSWTTDKDNQGDFLAHVLRHKYERGVRFNSSSLSGVDDLLLTCLAPLAAELGISLYLAHLQTEQFYPTEARNDDWDEKEPDDEDYEDYGDEEIITLVKEVVDLHGLPVRLPQFKTRWGKDWDEAFLCSSFIEDLTELNKPDEDKIERTDGNFGLHIKTWKHCAIILSTHGPVKGDTGIGEVYDYAFHQLGDSLSQKPTSHEKRIVDQLIARCRLSKERLEETNYDDPEELEAIRAKESIHIRTSLIVLRDCAERWNQPGLFLQALEACEVDKNVDIIGAAAFVSAYKTFGWQYLVDFCSRIVKNDGSISRRNAFLAQLARLGAEEADAELTEWVQTHEELVLNTLGEVLSDDIPRLVEITVSRGRKFFTDTLLPQLRSKRLDTSFWIAFITQLSLAASKNNQIQHCLGQCVDQLVEGLPAFPVHDIKSPYSRDPAEKDVAKVLQVIEVCFSVGAANACSRIFLDMRNATRDGQFKREAPPWLYYTELVTPVLALMQNDDEKLEIFRPFFEDVVRVLLNGATDTPNGSITASVLNDAQQVLIIESVKKAGGLELLQSFTVENFKGRSLDIVIRFIRRIGIEFPRTTLDSEMYDKTMGVLVGIATALFQYPSKIPPMIDLLRLCFDVGVQSHCGPILVRFTQLPTGADIKSHVSSILGPLLLQLSRFLETLNIKLTSKPYNKFSAAVVKSFTDQVLGDKPTAAVPSVGQIEAIGCTCSDCEELRTFLLHDVSNSHAFSRNAPVRSHLEEELDSARRWGITWETIKLRTPYTLKITKPPNMVAHAQWGANSFRAKELLLSLGDSVAQAEILGADYFSVYTSIYGAEPQNRLKRSPDSLDDSRKVKRR